MGQRTAILIKKNSKDKSTISLLHHQWGIGKVLPSLFLQEILRATYNPNRSIENTWGRGEREPIQDLFTFQELNNPQSNYITDVVVDKNLDVFSIPTVVEYFNRTDNNNGGLILEVTQKYDKYGKAEYYGDMLDVKYAFVLGSEECDIWNGDLQESIELENPFTRLISVEEFASLTFGENDESIQKATKKFTRSFRTLADMFGMKDMSRKKINRKINNEAQAIRARAITELGLLAKQYKETGIKPAIPEGLKNIGKKSYYK